MHVVSIWQMIDMTTPLMSRRFGVEIGFLATITQEQAVASLRAAGIEVEFMGYTHRTTPQWKVVTDGSCGYELVSPVLEGEAGLEEVRRAAAALEAAGARVDKRCGFHVHFDARGMGLKAIRNLFKMWLKFEDVLDTFQPPSRRGDSNTYCQSNLRERCGDAGRHRAACAAMFEAVGAKGLVKFYTARAKKLAA
jgi:hypothetical protein